MDEEKHMSELDEIIKLFRSREQECRVGIELSKFFAHKEIEKLENEAEEASLVSNLLEDLNFLSQFKEATMYANYKNMGFRQTIEIDIPVAKSSSRIDVMDLNTRDIIDTIELSTPISREKLEIFAKIYASKL